MIGGGQDDDNGVARIVLLSFSEKLQTLDIQTIGPNSMNCVYALTRMPFENVFFAGGYGTVTSFYLDEEKGVLQSLRDFEDIMSGEISDLKFEKEVLYVLSPAQEEIGRLNFKVSDKKNTVQLSSGQNEVQNYLSDVTKNFKTFISELEGKSGLSNPGS